MERCVDYVGVWAWSQPILLMRIERFDDFADFLSLRTDWDTVYRNDPEAQFFLSWQWLAGALQTYPGEWLVLVARGAEGRALGFLPLWHKTVWSESRECLRSELHFAGQLFWADYNGILCLPDQEAAVLPAFAEHLKLMDWSYLYLKEFWISDRRFELFMAPFADERLLVESRTNLINNGRTDNLVSPHVDLPTTFEAYLTERLSSNSRQKLRRLLRKLESSPEYQITTTDAVTRSRDVKILERLWSRMWRERKGSETDTLAAKYGLIVQRGLDDGLVRMSVLWHNGNPIGVLASFVDWVKSRMLFFVGARDGDFVDLPVGLLLHACNIRWAIENGLRTYDFLRGDEAYKYSLGATDVRLKYPRIRTRTGVNLTGKLDPRYVSHGMRIAEEFVQRAVAACHQILDVSPEHEGAKRLLNTLADGPPKLQS
jgi:CelD/BcsL family acetyltransferase involved in cellulose biosynthesis